MNDKIIYHDSELHYYREGTGGKCMLLFHGFGQDHLAFTTWSEALKAEYSVYTFDLFFHGRSKWENQQIIGHQDWKNILLLFFDKEGMGRFELSGFSIGAKFALLTVTLFPDRIDKIILVAPDGIKKSFWYSLATGTSLVRAIFRSLVLNPKRIRALVLFLNFFHLEDRELLRFAEVQLSSDAGRRRVYNSWIYFRDLGCDLVELSHILNSSAIPVIFVLGKFDKVIPSGQIKRFASTLKNHQFYLLDATHQNLIRKAIEYLAIKNNL
jgi:pimeloyl-ACP methyl ester carboxylesterase